MVSTDRDFTTVHETPKATTLASRGEKFSSSQRENRRIGRVWRAQHPHEISKAVRRAVVFGTVVQYSGVNRGILSFSGAENCLACHLLRLHPPQRRDATRHETTTIITYMMMRIMVSQSSSQSIRAESIHRQPLSSIFIAFTIPSTPNLHRDQQSRLHSRGIRPLPPLPNPSPSPPTDSFIRSSVFHP